MGALAGAVMLIFTSGGYVHHTMPPSVAYFATMFECDLAKSLVEIDVATKRLKGDVTVMCLPTGGNQ